MSKNATSAILFTLPFCLLLAGAPAAWAEEAEEPSASEEGEPSGSEESGEPAAPEEGEATSEEVEPSAEAVEEVEPSTEAVEESATPEDTVVESATPEGVEEDASTEGTEPPPTEETAEAEKEAGPEVRLVAELGVNILFGNTRSVQANGLLTGSVAGDGNKLGWNFGGAYGRGLPAATEEVPEPDEWVENARRVFGGLRYDRALIPEVNSLYFAGSGLHDTFAGLRLQAQANVGYSHEIIKSEKHHLVGEAGFNYSYDLYLPDADPKDQHFAGARVFVGYRLKLDSFGFSQSIEALLGGRNNMDAPFDGRISSLTGVTANINSKIGVKFGFSVIYDIAPPVDFSPVDTQTTLTLVATIL